METTINLPAFYCRAEIGSFDEAANTVDVIWSTGAAVRRYDWMERTEYDEVLSLEPGAVRLGRLQAGAPLLDSHSRWGLDDVIGVVTSASVRSGKGYATIRLSSAEKDADRVRKIKDGVVRNVSVGYLIHRIEKTEPTERGAVPVYRAVDWEPIEISAVPVPADPGAQFRAEDAPTSACTVVTSDPPTDDKRATAIRQLSHLAGEAGQELAARAIADGISVETFRTQLMTTLATRSNAENETSHVGVTGEHDSPDAFVRNAAAALYVSRVNPRAEMPAAARRYAGMTLLDLAREALSLRNVPVAGLSASGTIGAALGRASGSMVTTDFPALLTEVGRRTLRDAYEQVPSALRTVARQTTAMDFRPKTSVQLSEAPNLEKVNEHGEFKFGGMAEAKESYKIDTFGRIVSLTRQAIVNDDLNAFADLSAKMGRAAANFEAQFLVDLLTQNSGAGPTMDDTLALFHASHGNLAAAGAAISETTLSAARLAMRKQTDLTGQIVAPTPRYLVVPSDLETTGEKQLATIKATLTADVNVFAGRLALLVEPRFTSATAWYLAADPASCPGLEYAYLSGDEGPQVESRIGFEVDGVDMRVRLDFGGGFVDFRSWYRNPGE